ncbi:MAG: osmC-like family protein [Rhodocyclales bacterium]|nr:osmC-like family protein [Rhodocyclales bacterium]MDB5888699.1 osmC-like family protein [Rhodocyclales bacterium]
MKIVAQANVISGGIHYHHDIQVGHHRLIADEPATRGGHDDGPAPYDYVLAGLGACTAITLRMYAEKKGWALGRLSVALKLSKDENDNATIERTLHADGTLDEAQWTRLLEIAEKTPVTKTLRAGATITTRRG